MKRTITGTQLKHWRTKHGWSRAMLAIILDKSHQTICNAEQLAECELPPNLCADILPLVAGSKIIFEIEIEHPI